MTNLRLSVQVSCLVAVVVLAISKPLASDTPPCPDNKPYCGNNSSVNLTSPFALRDQCNSNRGEFHDQLDFSCSSDTLVLTFLSNPLDSYRVTKINYTANTLRVEPCNNGSRCRPFNSSSFLPLVLSTSSTLILSCNTSSLDAQCWPNDQKSLCDNQPKGFSCPYNASSSPQQNEILHRSCHLNSTLDLQWMPPSAPSLAPVPSAVPPVVTQSKNKALVSTEVALGVLSCSVVAAMVICFCCWRRKARAYGGDSTQFLSDTKDFERIHSGSTMPTFSYKELEHATQGFSESQELGGGGFGTVYHGKLNDGRLVAVKKLNQGGSQGIQQFQNEVRVLSQVRHPHLVQLLGCCMERPLLVYEFVPNGSIARHLHGMNPDKFQWAVRLDIAIETAQALSYLHFDINPPIVHRDVKTTNILLDINFKAKVGDFGLSRLTPNMEVSHISTAPQGTPGYLDPDYHESYRLSDKSDVYSFGVVLMELVTAKKAVDMARERREINLASLALAKIQCGCLEEIIDPSLKNVFITQPLVKIMVNQVAELAFRCLAVEKDDRPSMKEVLAELQRIRNFGYGKPLSSESFNNEEAMFLSDKDTKPLFKEGTFWPPSPTSVQDVWVSHTTSPSDSQKEMV